MLTNIIGFQHNNTGIVTSAATYKPFDPIKNACGEVGYQLEHFDYNVNGARQATHKANTIGAKWEGQGLTTDFVQLCRGIFGTHTADQSFRSITWDHKISCSSSAPTQVNSMYCGLTGGDEDVYHSYINAKMYQHQISIGPNGELITGLGYWLGKRSASAALSASPVNYCTARTSHYNKQDITIYADTSGSEKTIKPISFSLTSYIPKLSPYYVMKETDDEHIAGYVGEHEVITHLAFSIYAGTADANAIDGWVYNQTPKDYCVFIRKGAGGAENDLACAMTNALATSPSSFGFATKIPGLYTILLVCDTAIYYDRCASIADARYTE